jgi:hypothetical protein
VRKKDEILEKKFKFKRKPSRIRRIICQRIQKPKRKTDLFILKRFRKDEIILVTQRSVNEKIIFVEVLNEILLTKFDTSFSVSIPQFSIKRMDFEDKE